MTAGICEVTVRRVAAVVEEPGRKPYNPLVLLAVDLESGLVVHQDLRRPGVSPDILARALARGFRRAGYRPSVVRCRDPELVPALARALAPLEIRVERVAWLDAADDLLDELEEQLSFGPAPWDYWSELESVYADVAGLMEDAARYYVQAPWRVLADNEIIMMAADGRRRYLSVLGAAGQTYGLAVFMSRRGAERVLEAGGVPLRRFPDQVAVVFDDGSDLPPLLRELIRERYPVAGPAAYPTFLGTRRGRHSVPGAADLRLLRAALQAVPLLIRELRRDGRGRRDDAAPRDGRRHAHPPSAAAGTGTLVACSAVVRLDDGPREVTLAVVPGGPGVLGC